jgi:hypothetical protein
MRLSSPQRALRGPGESYSDVILRLTAEEGQGLSRGAERQVAKLVEDDEIGVREAGRRSAPSCSRALTSFTGRRPGRDCDGAVDADRHS